MTFPTTILSSFIWNSNFILFFHKKFSSSSQVHDVSSHIFFKILVAYFYIFLLHICEGLSFQKVELKLVFSQVLPVSEILTG
jgi:hypothetical protein